MTANIVLSFVFVSFVPRTSSCLAEGLFVSPGWEGSLPAAKVGGAVNQTKKGAGTGPALLCGGKNIGLQHRGHLIKDDDYLGNLWQTMFTVMGVPVPENFQGGEADGPIKELL